MEKVAFSDVVGIGGIVFAIVLLVLDKAGKLKGGWLFGLLCLAGAMTLFIALGNSWVIDAPVKWKLWRGGLMASLVAFTYSGLAIWISASPTSESREVAEKPASRSEPPSTKADKLLETKPQLPPSVHSESHENKSVVIQPPYGNLAIRCKELGEHIIGYVQERNHKIPEQPWLHQEEYSDWFRQNDFRFRVYFYDDIKKLQRDLAAANIVDSNLDKLIETHETLFALRNKLDAQFVKDNPAGFHLNIEQIEEIGRRFVVLASEVPQH